MRPPCGAEDRNDRDTSNRATAFLVVHGGLGHGTSRIIPPAVSALNTMRLQMAMDRRSKFVEALSNVLKEMAGAEVAIA